MDPLVIAYILIAIAVVLMITELFIPTGGICIILAIALFLGGIALSFYYGDRRTGIVTSVVVFVIVPVGLIGWLWLWPNSWGKPLTPTFDDEATVVAMTGQTQLEQLRGRVGKSISALRPSGVAEFDGKRVDCMSEGMLIEAGRPLRCVDVKAGKVIVRQIDAPKLETLETTDFG